jgi:hypothetical protein
MHTRSRGSYRYSPLEAGDSFRLIELLPSKDKAAAVHCSLIHSTLSHVRESITSHYTALSYVWGNVAHKATIHVNGLTLKVTASPDCALKHLRDEEATFYVWADGICIDQNDDDEKCQQVRQMGGIYECAQHTVIFLGEGDPATERGLLDILKNSNGLSSLPKDANSSIALCKVLESPWFYRVWIFQEFVLSRDPKVQYGNVRCTWEKFCAAMKPTAGYQARVAVVTNMRAAKHSREEMALRELQSKTVLSNEEPAPRQFAPKSVDDSVQTKETLALEYFTTLLASRRGFGVSDPRDMLFAHCGLVKDCGVEVNYNQTVIKAYEMFARKHIERTGSLKILSYIEDVELNQRRSGLPSWTPDWTSTWLHKKSNILNCFGGSDYNNQQWTPISPQRIHSSWPKSRANNFSQFDDDFWFEEGILCSVGVLASTIHEVSPVLENIIDEVSAQKTVVPENSSYKLSEDELFAHPFGRVSADVHIWSYWKEEHGLSSEFLDKTEKQRKARTGRLLSLQKRCGHHLNRVRKWKQEQNRVHYVLKEVIKEVPWTEDDIRDSSFVKDHLERRLNGKKLNSSNQPLPSIVDGRRIARIDQGHAFVPPFSRKGDHIYFLRHGNTPFVVREVKPPLAPASFQNQLGASKRDKESRDVKHVKMIGECYIENVHLTTPSPEVLLVIH